MGNVPRIQAQIERVGVDALHWAVLMNLQLIAPLLMTAIRSLSFDINICIYFTRVCLYFIEYY